MQNPKEANKDTDKKPKLFQIGKIQIIIIFSILILAALGLGVYLYFLMIPNPIVEQQYKPINHSQEILSSVLDIENNLAIIGLDTSLLPSNVSGLKFVFKDISGNEYGFLAENISQAIIQNYSIDLKLLQGLNDSSSLNEISLEVIYKVADINVTNNTNKSKPAPPKRLPNTSDDDSSSDSSDSEEGTPAPTVCTASKTCAKDYAGQCRNHMSNGCEDELDCTDNCNSDQYCYSEESLYRCVTRGINSTDSDISNDKSVQGNLVVCKNNSCVSLNDGCIIISSSDYLVGNESYSIDYYASFNGTEFEIKNTTSKCDYRCVSGKCIGCENSAGCEEVSKQGEYFCENNKPYECIMNSTTGCIYRKDWKNSCGSSFICINKTGCKSLACSNDSECSFLDRIYCSENAAYNLAGICDASTKKCTTPLIIMQEHLSCSYKDNVNFTDSERNINTYTCTRNLTSAFCSLNITTQRFADNNPCTMDKCNESTCYNLDITVCDYFSSNPSDCEQDICRLNCTWGGDSGCITKQSQGSAQSLGFLRSILEWFKRVF